MDRQIHRWTDR